MTYPEALAAIAALEPRGWKLGLERMTEFVRRIGLEAAVDGTRRKYVHVAGTNGKGTTTAYVQSVLVAAGLRTGGFFSPYVLDPRERVQLNGQLIPTDRFAELTQELLGAAAQFDDSEFGGISEFEFKTALGFLYWEREGADWVALETGLGGRLDSTNVVTPSASIIVSIGLDHQALLGDTVELIAFEKAGIIKPGRPVVVGQMPEGARNVILRVASERQSPAWRFGEEIRVEGETLHTPAGSIEGLETQLVGVWQLHNLALAIAALQMAEAQVDHDAILRGARMATIPGRFQRVTHQGAEYILDGAHNEDSAIALARTLEVQLEGKKMTLLTNMLTGHEPEAFYRYLQPHIDKAFVVPIDFHRSRRPVETAEALRDLGIEAQAVDSIEDGLECTEAIGNTILVTGSFYLVGDVGRLLGLGPK
jgi:dihydrofolate synthase/folylpolyglutamate synthase